MTANSADADAQRTTNDEKHSGPCPDCGGTTYYEPNITHGTRYEPTSGWACLDCSWSKLDPESGETRPTAEAYPDACQQGIIDSYRCPTSGCNEGVPATGKYAIVDMPYSAPDDIESVTFHGCAKCGTDFTVGSTADDERRVVELTEESESSRERDSAGGQE